MNSGEAERGFPGQATVAAALHDPWLFGQVLILSRPPGFELHHCDDPETASLSLIDLPGLRLLAQTSSDGEFRPLKSAPSLQRGWKFLARHLSDVERALHEIYPGALADWTAWSERRAFPVDYRSFTGRQTGMYRITTHLSDAQARPMIRACCHPHFCLKQRLWTVAELPPDPPATKSIIPCLEPCALLLEFARTVARLEQERERNPSVEGEAEPGGAGPCRVADFGNAANPRRRQWRVEKLAKPGEPLDR